MHIKYQNSSTLRTDNFVSFALTILYSSIYILYNSSFAFLSNELQIKDSDSIKSRQK